MGLPVSRRFQVVFTIAWLCLAVASFSMVVQMAFKIDVYLLRRVTGALMFLGVIGVFGSAFVAAIFGSFNTSSTAPAPVIPAPQATEPRGFPVEVEPAAVPAQTIEPPRRHPSRS